MKISRLPFCSLLALPALFVAPVLSKPTAVKQSIAATELNCIPKADQILAVEKSRYAAMVKADVAALKPMLADDLTYIRSTGVVQNKAGLLDEVKSRKMRYQKIEPQKPTIRIHGDTAIVTGQTYFELVRYGKEEDVMAVFTAVYVLNGKPGQRHWQLAAWQSNLTPTKKQTAATKPAK